MVTSFSASSGAGIGVSALAQNLASVEPNLDADPAVSGLSLGKAVVDVRSDGLKRDSALVISLCTGDLSAAETAGNLSLDALCAELHGSADGLLKGTTVGNTSLELRSNALCNKLSIEIGLLDLDDVEGNLFAAELLLADLLELLYLSALAADDHAGLSAVNVDVNTLSVAFDLNLGYSGRSELLKKVLTEIVIFNESITELVGIRIPAGFPVLKPVGLIFCPIV